jgi:hypothetical protein
MKRTTLIDYDCLYFLCSRKSMLEDIKEAYKRKIMFFISDLALYCLANHCLRDEHLSDEQN